MKTFFSSIIKNQKLNILNRFNFLNFNFKSFSVANPPIISLSTISDNPGARIKKTIVGRGPGCKKGKTSGRGHKGKQHGYKPPVHIQGGQSPIQKTFPTIPFIRKAPIYTEVNIKKVVELIKQGRINPENPITIKELGRNGAFSKIREGVKLLGKGIELLKTIPPITIIVNHASQSVINAIKENGGTLICEYKDRLALKFQMKPYKFIKIIRDPVINFRKAKVYMKLETKGAQIRFIKPNWLKNEYEALKIKLEEMRKKVDEQSNVNLLPVYPVKKYKGMSDNIPRKRNRIIPKKLVFDGKTGLKLVHS